MRAGRRWPGRWGSGWRRPGRWRSGRWGFGRRGDRGAATVWTAFAACALCVVFGAVLALGQAVAARHRAGGAADLAVLAAADRALWGEAEACAAASRVAGAQGAEVVRCAVRGELAEVTARVAGGSYRPEVRSRAGPPELLPGPRGQPEPPPGPSPGLPGPRGGVP
ncbi:Rv3654c family TadE-like protein [Streptomyces sp. NPDC000961]|uniref:Rv3654c family TadE-like protein n=1 Tax=Streptomyces sp. NPDC000961 TaxID=3364541 RepID=UPI0036AEEF85